MKEDAVKPAPLRVVLSGSWHGYDFSRIQAERAMLVSRGLEVLSPGDLSGIELDIAATKAAFVRLPNQKKSDAALIELDHLEAIDRADFLWVRAPGGRIGVSVAMEIGYAFQAGKLIFCVDRPEEEALRGLVMVVSDIDAAIIRVACGRFRT